jgi:hypothetical protein
MSVGIQIRREGQETDPRAERDVGFLRMQCNAEKHSLGVGLVGGSLFFLGAQRAIWVLSNGSFANFFSVKFEWTSARESVCKMRLDSKTREGKHRFHTTSVVP